MYMYVHIVYLCRLRYRPRHAIFHGNAGQVEDYVSYWDHIENLHNNSMLFYNFKYQPSETAVSKNPHTHIVTPFCFVFYTINLTP